MITSILITSFMQPDLFVVLQKLTMMSYAIYKHIFRSTCLRSAEKMLPRAACTVRNTNLYRQQQNERNIGSGGPCCKKLFSREFNKHLGINLSIKTCQNVHFFHTDQDITRDENMNVDALSASDILERLSAKDKKKLMALQLEYDYFLECGPNVPENMTDERWFEIFKLCEEEAKRKKLYLTWYRMDMRKNKLKLPQTETVSKTLTKNADKDTSFTYLKFSSSLYSKEKVRKYIQNNINFGIQHGMHIIFDMSFERVMKPNNQKLLIQSVFQAYLRNGDLKEPLHMVFCSVEPGSDTEARLKEIIDEYNMLVTVTHKSYSELYPKSDLVYLSPNAREEMYQLDLKKTYIIGCVEENNVYPHSIEKSRKEDIQAFRFPLGKYLK